MEQKEITMRPDDNIWKIALVLVCIGILAYGFFYSKNTTTNLVYLFGYNLPLALFVWAIFYVAVARKRGGKVAGFSFLAIFISMIASGQKNDYLLEFEAIGWNSILDPQRIRVDKGLVESKVTIRRAKKIVAKYKEKTNVLLHNAREKIQSLNMSASSKRKALSGFDRGMDKAKNQIDAMWTIEGELLKEFENIINLLSARNGSWVVEEGQILFYNDSDLNRFNSYIASIQSLINQQQQIQKQGLETVNRNFNRLKR